MSQKVAARLGVDPGTLARWERGAREPMGAAPGAVRSFLGDARVRAVGERLAG
jgi:transcriptional regulator with XRE-family HTH domain